MVEYAEERVKQTKRHLRKQTLNTVFEQFDTHIMELTKTERQLKYEKMKADPFSFFRGSAYLFYYDMTTVPFSYHTPEDKPTWMMGDLHFENFSGFQNEAGEMIFDVDDFDEGYLGSYLYDLLRMVVSIRLFAAEQGFQDKEQDAFVENYLKTYTKNLGLFVKEKADPVTKVFTAENTAGPIRDILKKLEKRKRTHRLEKHTVMDKQGNRMFNREKKKLTSLSPSEYEEVQQAWEEYLESIPKDHFRGKEHYQIKDIVGKAGAGIGSTGLKRFLILVEGDDATNPDSDVILEAKEARMPIPAYFFPYHEAFWTANRHQGQRVVATQQAMHYRPDPYLGHFTVQNREFYVRERSAYEKDLKPNQFQTTEDVGQTLQTMAEISAKIHARADDNIEYELFDYQREDEIVDAIGKDEKGFIKELSIWAEFYQKRVLQDYQLFLEWLDERSVDNEK